MKSKKEIIETNDDLQDTFNIDSIDLLVEDGSIENEEDSIEEVLENE